jgi:hypothetical protein
MYGSCCCGLCACERAVLVLTQHLGGGGGADHVRCYRAGLLTCPVKGLGPNAMDLAVLKLHELSESGLRSLIISLRSLRPGATHAVLVSQVSHTHSLFHKVCAAAPISHHKHKQHRVSRLPCSPPELILLSLQRRVQRLVYLCHTCQLHMLRPTEHSREFLLMQLQPDAKPATPSHSSSLEVFFWSPQDPVWVTLACCTSKLTEPSRLLGTDHGTSHASVARPVSWVTSLQLTG